MAAYEGLADIYDELMDDFDYDAWAAHYLCLTEMTGVKPRRVCECACGTGSLTIRFASCGLKVTGVDISEAMLARAQIKTRQAGVQAAYVLQDMRCLELPRPVDAIFCTCDGVNYLTEDAHLDAFFGSVRRFLKPGGAFVFDISSAYKLEHMLGSGFFGETREHIAYLWSNHFDETARTARMELTFFLEEENGLYRRFEETHIQRAYSIEEITQALERNGFALCRVCGDFTPDPPQAESKRIHFAAVRT